MYILWQVLANAVVGVTASGEDTDEVPEASSDSTSFRPNKLGEHQATNYVVIGTKTASEVAKPEWVAEIIDVSNNYTGSVIKTLHRDHTQGLVTIWCIRY